MEKRSVTVAAVDVEALEREADAAVAAASSPDELDDRTARAPGLLEVERHILDHARAPRVVQLRDRVVRARHHRYRSSMVRVRAAFLFSPPRLAAGDRA